MPSSTPRYCRFISIGKPSELAAEFEQKFRIELNALALADIADNPDPHYRPAGAIAHHIGIDPYPERRTVFAAKAFFDLKGLALASVPAAGNLELISPVGGVS